MVMTPMYIMYNPITLCSIHIYTAHNMSHLPRVTTRNGPIISANIDNHNRFTGKH